MVKQSCANCKNWVDATAECAVALGCVANNESIPETINKAMDKDKNQKNTCEMYDLA